MPFYPGHKMTKGTKRNPILCDMLNEESPMGINFKDEFMDCGRDQLLTAHSILDQIALHDGKSIKVIFDKEFLRKIIHSHIVYIRNIDVR